MKFINSVIFVFFIVLDFILCKNVTSVTDPLQRVMLKFNLYQVFHKLYLIQL